LGALPPEVLPKIDQLARLLQQVVNDGTLSERQINQEMNHGNLAGLVDDLNPEAKQLLDDIVRRHERTAARKRSACC